MEPPEAADSVAEDDNDVVASTGYGSSVGSG